MVRKAVIPAAGSGTRFLPATKAQPKEMLPIIDTPTIQYVVQEAADSGIEDILIITGKGKRAIEDHFDRNPELEQILETKNANSLHDEIRQISEIANIHYIRQKEQLGLGVVHPALIVTAQPAIADLEAAMGRPDAQVTGTAHRPPLALFNHRKGTCPGVARASSIQ